MMMDIFEVTAPYSQRERDTLAARYMREFTLERDRARDRERGRKGILYHAVEGVADTGHLLIEDSLEASRVHPIPIHNHVHGHLTSIALFEGCEKRCHGGLQRCNDLSAEGWRDGKGGGREVNNQHHR
jgi:hypothetical protein